MATIAAQRSEPDNNYSGIDEVRRTAERRLREIEREVEPLISEAEQLRQVLSVIDGAGSGANVRAAVNSRRREATAGRQPGRAARGSNKRTILELVAAHPGIRPSEIAQQTGIGPRVVSTTLSRLKRQGLLAPTGGYDVGVRLADAAPAAS